LIPHCDSCFLRTALLLYNQQLPQSALGSKTPLQTMKGWYKLKPELFRNSPIAFRGGIQG